MIEREKIVRCYDEKTPIYQLAEIFDGIGAALVTANAPLVEEYLRYLAELVPKASAALIDEGDRRHLNQITSEIRNLGYEGLRRELETKGNVPRGYPFNLIFVGEVVRCTCPQSHDGP